MDFNERRKEPRYPIQANAKVKVSKDGESAPGITVNISGAGALVDLHGTLHVKLGDQVVCEFDLHSESDKPLSSWATGRVTRVEGSRIAIALESGEFASAAGGSR